MRRLLPLITLLILAAAPARAQVDVDMAFDPATASAGEIVTFYASIANLGDAAVVADLELTVSFGLYEIGPILAHLPLAAGEELSLEIPFPVPAMLGSGELTITATASADGYSDTATASLLVTGTTSSTDPGTGLGQIGEQIATAIANATVDNASESVGSLKATW